MNGDHNHGKGGRSSAAVFTTTTFYIIWKVLASFICADVQGAIGNVQRLKIAFQKRLFLYATNTHTQNNIPTKVNNVTKKPDATPFGAAAAVTGRNVDVGTGTGTGSGVFGKPVTAPVAEATP